jgi:Tat protein translocase TatB subunit
MLNVGTPELLVILVVALVVLGPNKLPGAARQIGRAVAEVRRMSSGFQAELRDAFQEPLEGMTTPVSDEPVPDDEQREDNAGDGGARTRHGDAATG